ncbi:MAG: GDP-L-fucose synthase [Proteobacteria bacterium]|nr:GDP-L-fucose synthase [Pseudomonadota bacterium]MBU1738788.1 GDP-L-fucose synthase [Pseudomonadota bacterium]
MSYHTKYSLPLSVNAKIYVAGHRGLVGSAMVRELEKNGFSNLITRTRSELDLLNQEQVDTFFAEIRPEFVIDAAAKVGGIYANNTYPADFIYENLKIQNNIIHASHVNNVNRLLFLGSSCIYPKLAPQPMKEEYLLTGPLEATNDAYALAKIAGIKMCESYNRQYHTRFLSVMPTNLYGPGDNFDLENSHVLPALIRKFHEAKISGEKTVTVWGTGKARREFLHVDDMARGCIHLLGLEEEKFTELITHLKPTIINLGTGKDTTIRDLAETVQKVVGFQGEIVFDPGKPDGTPQKLLDISRISALGWQPEIPLEQGIKSTYEWFLASPELRL